MGPMSIDGVLLSREQALISPFSLACAYGYGLFETLLVRDQKPLFLNRHLDRLYNSAVFLRMEVPNRDYLIQWTYDVLNTGEQGQGRLKITLLAEAAVEQGTVSTNALISFQAGLPYKEELYFKGVTAGLLDLTRNEDSPLVKHKTLNYLENILAKRMAKERGYFEGIFLNSKGMVSEGTVSNVFLVRGDKLITPAVEQGLLPGITRDAVIEIAREHGLPVLEREVSPEELSNAEEIFLTNSLMGIMPVTEFQGSVKSGGKPGTVTRRVMELYQEAEVI